MGNAIAKDNDTINWNNVKTDNFSENINNKQLTNDSKLLISRLQLNIPTVNDTESDNLSDIFNKYQIQPSVQQTQNNGELSDTSPFISSDMYNYLLNKNQISNGQKGGAKLDDDSSTSSTSSSSSDSEESETEKKKNKKSKSESEKSESESENNDSDLSYVSSPGNTDKSEKSESEEESELSGGSISNNNEDLPPSSINTSDINMVSESS